MLFNGWSVAQKSGGDDPWSNHPFNITNNINGINGDPNNDGNAYETENDSNNSITSLQEAYVRHVIDNVNDLDNVLYEIANEPDGEVNGTLGWINHMIDYIHTYDAGKPKQHPVWFTVPWPGNNGDLRASNTEAIAPNSDVNNDGMKVVISDTDHYFGIGGSAEWAWKQFTGRAGGIAYMDSWNNLFLDCSDRGHPIQNFQDNLGYIRSYADRLNLENMTPHGELASTGYALANPSPIDGEFLVYLPAEGSMTVNLTSLPGSLYVEWLDPDNGMVTVGNPVTGGTNISFTPPFSGTAVLYIRKTVPVPAYKSNLPLIHSSRDVDNETRR